MTNIEDEKPLMVRIAEFNLDKDLRGMLIEMLYKIQKQDQQIQQLKKEIQVKDEFQDKQIASLIHAIEYDLPLQ